MKLTKEDQAMFKSLSKSDIGKWLVDYAKRVQDYAHDSRSWDKDDTKESARQASKLISECFVEKIRPNPESPLIVESEFE